MLATQLVTHSTMEELTLRVITVHYLMEGNGDSNIC